MPTTGDVAQAQTALVNVASLECALCLSLFCEPITIPCGHTFCRTCLIPALRRSKKKCPNCRAVCHISPETHAETTVVAYIVKTYFPEAYARRVEETAADKAALGMVLPIFFYNSTLFPGAKLALNFFEDRYKIMMRRVNDGSRTFIFLPNFVNYVPTNGDVGLVAELEECEFRANGQVQVQARCKDRVRIKDWWVEEDTANLHYAATDVVRDEAVDAAVEAELFARVNAAIEAYFSGPGANRKRAILEHLGPVPTKLEALSFWLVSAFLASQRAVQGDALLVYLATTDTVDRINTGLQSLAALMPAARAPQPPAAAGGAAAAAAAAEAAEHRARLEALRALSREVSAEMGDRLAALRNQLAAVQAEEAAVQLRIAQAHAEQERAGDAGTEAYQIAHELAIELQTQAAQLADVSRELRNELQIVEEENELRIEEANMQMEEMELALEQAQLAAELEAVRGEAARAGPLAAHRALANVDSSSDDEFDMSNAGGRARLDAEMEEFRRVRVQERELREREERGRAVEEERRRMEEERLRAAQMQAERRARAEAEEAMRRRQDMERAEAAAKERAMLGEERARQQSQVNAERGRLQREMEEMRAEQERQRARLGRQVEDASARREAERRALTAERDAQAAQLEANRQRRAAERADRRLERSDEEAREAEERARAKREAEMKAKLEAELHTRKVLMEQEEAARVRAAVEAQQRLMEEEGRARYRAAEERARARGETERAEMGARLAEQARMREEMELRERAMQMEEERLRAEVAALEAAEMAAQREAEEMARREAEAKAKAARQGGNSYGGRLQ